MGHGKRPNRYVCRPWAYISPVKLPFGEPLRPFAEVMADIERFLAPTGRSGLASDKQATLTTADDGESDPRLSMGAYDPDR